MPTELLAGKPLKVVNIGAEHFGRELQAQGVPVVQVRWQPRVMLGPELERILAEVL